LSRKSDSACQGLKAQKVVRLANSNFAGANMHRGESPIRQLGTFRFRWFQFGLRTLLCLVTLCAALLGWWSWQFGWVRYQASAISRLTELGGEVITVTARPAWAQRLLGKEWFIRATEAYLPSTADDSALEDVRELKALRRLALAGSHVTDPALAHLAGLHELRDLDLGRTAITNNGLRHLGRLRNLERLRLDSTDITDTGLAQLTRLTELRLLDLCGTNITDRGLQSIKHFAKLESLHLDGTSITDAGLKHLTGLGQLVQVSLSDTQLTEQGFRNLHAERPSVWVLSHRIQLHGDRMSAIAFCPTRQIVAAGFRDGRVAIWDLDAGQLVSEVGADKWEIRCMAFAPDGQTLATASPEGPLKLWDVSVLPMRMRRELETGQVHSLTFAPDGSVLAQASDGASWGDPGPINLWNVATGELDRQLLHKYSSIYLTLAYSNDGRILAGGTREGSVVFWDVPTWSITTVLEYEYDGPVHDIAFDRSNFLAVVDRGKPELLNPLSGQLIEAFPGPVVFLDRLTLSSDNNWLVARQTQWHDETRRLLLKIWSLRGARRSAPPVTLRAPMRESTVDAVFSPDSRRLVAGCDDGSLLIWEVPTAQPSARDAAIGGGR
jgi:WD40 repeat protein